MKTQSIIGINQFAFLTYPIDSGIVWLLVHLLMELTYKQLLFHVLTHAQELLKSIKTEITLEEQ